MSVSPGNAIFATGRFRDLPTNPTKPRESDTVYLATVARMECRLRDFVAGKQYPAFPIPIIRNIRTAAIRAMRR
jgi:hypothetical protein